MLDQHIDGTEQPPNFVSATIVESKPGIMLVQSCRHDAT